jgi:N-acetylglucosaminyl-diphospho-decaprenol L-rhamnosyltransferase
MINIFAIIVTYNGAKWIEKCLASIMDSTLTVKIIIMDNGSKDDTRAKIKNKFPQVDIVESSTNLGVCKANNTGIKKAYDLGATHFFILNQDAWIETDTIEKLVVQQQKNIGYGVLSPLHLNGCGNALDFNFSTYIIPSKCPGLYSDFCLNSVKDEIYPVEFVNSAAWLVSRECIEKVGGFNPSFFQYGDDDNYIHRVHYFGYKVGVYPLARMFHDREKRSKGIYDEPLEKFKRTNLLKYSNPLRKDNIDSDRWKLMASAILYLLRGRIDLYKSFWKQYKILKEIAPSAKQNLSRSMQGGPLCFLN